MGPYTHTLLVRPPLIFAWPVYLPSINRRRQRGSIQDSCLNLFSQLNSSVVPRYLLRLGLESDPWNNCRLWGHASRLRHHNKDGNSTVCGRRIRWCGRHCSHALRQSYHKSVDMAQDLLFPRIRCRVRHDCAHNLFDLRPRILRFGSAYAFR